MGGHYLEVARDLHASGGFYEEFKCAVVVHGRVEVPAVDRMQRPQGIRAAKCHYFSPLALAVAG